MNNTEQVNVIEALLFALGRPMSKKELSQKLGISQSDIEIALTTLRSRMGGVVLVDDGITVELRTSPSVTSIIERLRKEEYSRDIGRAGLETLSAILYRGPLTRVEIDFIRGVNSSQILRTLLMRGLVRKTPHPRHQRSFLYEPTTELLAHLGITHISDLPNYNETRGKLSILEESYKAQMSKINEV